MALKSNSAKGYMKHELLKKSTASLPPEYGQDILCIFSGMCTKLSFGVVCMVFPFETHSHTFVLLITPCWLYIMGKEQKCFHFGPRRFYSTLEGLPEFLTCRLNYVPFKSCTQDTFYHVEIHSGFKASNEKPVQCFLLSMSVRRAQAALLR